ncbi:uncharacterized protein [Euwallacea fornicatus]|uniref:uncharacterized protein n=1 Tax=Euwallacea fornicatus TaxID=995702 RepID=UPI00338E1B82
MSRVFRSFFRRSRRKSTLNSLDAEPEVLNISQVVCKHYKKSIKEIDQDIIQEIRVLGEPPYVVRGTVTVTDERNITEYLNVFVKLFDTEVSPNDKRDFDLFCYRKEFQVYVSILPALTKFQESTGIDQEQFLFRTLIPRTYGATLSQKQQDAYYPDNSGMLILEDLSLQGYEVEEAPAGLELKSAVLAIRALAKMHAIVLAMSIKNTIEFFNKVMVHLEYESKYAYPDDLHTTILNLIKYDILDRPQLINYKSTIHKAIRRACFDAFDESEENPWHTMCHGRFWSQSIMFKKSEMGGEPISCKIINFKLAEYESCIEELIFFMYTSIQINVLDDEFDQFLEIYFQTFKDVLKKHNLDLDDTIYNFAAFLAEVNKIGLKALAEVLVHLREIVTKTENSEDHVDAKNEYFERLCFIFLHMIKQGWITVDQETTE